MTLILRQKKKFAQNVILSNAKDPEEKRENTNLPGFLARLGMTSCSHTESSVTRFTLPLFLIMLSAACIPKQNTVSDKALRKAHIPLFIEMPRNTLAFDNIAPSLYQSLHQHCLRVGYALVNKPSDGYSLHLNIKKFEPINKLVLPEVVLAHYTVMLELDAILFDFNHNAVIQKTFTFSSLISRPRNPILKSDFIEYEYKRLFERSAPRIEHFFRPHLLKTFDENKI